MNTFAIVIFLVSFWTTRSLVMSCYIAGGYYAVVAIGSFFLRKVGMALWLRLFCQLLVAALVMFGVCHWQGADAGPNTRQPPRMEDGKVESENNKTSNVSVHADATSNVTPPAQSKDEKVRDFILKESPRLWQTYQDVGVAIEELSVRIVKLRKTLEEFDVDADADVDCAKLVHKLDELKVSRAAMKRQMEKAYIESRKFAASPNRKEFDELRQKALEDGINEAQLAMRKFEELKEQK